jgi:5-methylcytosine-specific restriction endonuclease McrA
MTELKNGTVDETMKKISKTKEFSFLKIDEGLDNDEVTSNTFSREAKSAVYIVEALRNSIKCEICGSRIHKNSITIDHKIRKEDGGKGNFDNGQLAHPYCNSTYKN